MEARHWVICEPTYTITGQAVFLAADRTHNAELKGGGTKQIKNTNGQTVHFERLVMFVSGR